jgi:hypothetical protein
MNQKKIFFMVALLFFSGCAPKEESPSSALGDAFDLNNCDESFTGNIPEFYTTYFSCVNISMSNLTTVIESDNLPPYESWYYNVSHGNYIDYVSQGNGYYLNPNEITAQETSINILVNPTPRGINVNTGLVDGIVGTSNYEYGMGAVGIALNGVALFNPLAAPPDDIEDEKFSFDYYSGHPTNTGYYHYHTASQGPIDVLKNKELIENSIVGSADIELYGIMCDGTLILGCTELDGSVPDHSNFDAQNGHVHDISDASNVFFSNRYHTHICVDSFTDHRFTPEIQYYTGCD